MSTLFSASRLALAGSALFAVSAMTGCANMATTASGISTFSPNAVISGKLHGGNQAISNADVRLYAAGTTGYGSAPTLYAVTTSANDGFGSFGFTKTAGAGAGTTSVYGCPTGSDPQMYITARGGNTQGAGNGANTAAAFIVALGKCSTIGAGTLVDLNEVTTVGTMAALQQYFSPASANTDNLNHLGYPSTTLAATGFANGVATIGNLVNVATGVVNTTSTATGTPTGSTAAASVTITPEINKINTLANILAACVNTTSNTSTACGTLFADATPPSSAVTSQPALSFGTATDTLQAIYYMLTNPTSGSAANITALFNLTNAQAPFQPMSAAAPTDWTVGIKYSSTSACTAGNFLAAAYHVAPDASGNIWIAGGNATASNLMEISPTGLPLTCTLGGTVAGSHSLALDSLGNVWFAAGTTANLYKYVPSTGVTTTWPTLATPFVVAADAAGNVYYTAVTGTLVAKFTGAAAATTPTASTQIATVSTLPNFLAVDTAGNIYTTNSTTTAGALYVSSPSTATGSVGGYLTTSTGAVYNPYGVSIGLTNTAYISNSNYSGSTAPNSLSLYTFSGGTITPGFYSATFAGGVIAPRENAIDGAGNVWSPNSTAATTNYVTGGTGSFAITEFTATGVALSPTGNTGTASDSGGFQKDSSVLPAGGRGIAIDPTGNVWIGLNSAAAASTSITELVGAAVPVVTPIPAALAAGATTTNAVSKP